MKKDLFSIVVEWSDNEQEFVATCPEFSGLSAFGETKAEAFAEAELVLESFIEIHEEDGEPLPEPRKVECVSGQTRLRIPKSLHARLKRDAEKEGTSLNQYLVHLLSERQAYKEVLDEIDKRTKERQALVDSMALLKAQHSGSSSINVSSFGSFGGSIPSGVQITKEKAMDVELSLNPSDVVN